MPTTTPLSHSLNALLALALFAGLAACGPAPSDNAANVEPQASVGGPDYRPEARGTSRGERTLPTFASSPAPLAPHLLPATQGEARPAAPLVVPAWIGSDLKSPDVRVRLKALDRWGQQAPPGAVDPLILALEDKDERVQARALELIEQDWARAQAAEK